MIGIVTHSYTVLIEGTRAPVAIMHKNTVATQFKLHRNYAESVTLFENFIGNVNRRTTLEFD